MLKLTLLCFLAAALAVAQPKMTVDSPLGWIKAEPFHHWNFQTRLKDSHIYNRARLAPAMPYSLTVTDEGNADIVLIALIFEARHGTRTDRYIKVYNSFHNPKDPILSPGVSRWFSPFNSYNTLAAGATDAGIRNKDGTVVSEPVDELADADSLHASIDLVITREGSYAGPDRAHTIQSLQDERQAYADLRSEYLYRTAYRKDTHAWLRSVAAQRIIKDATDPLSVSHHYARYQRQIAGQLLTRPGAVEADPDARYPIVKLLKGGLQ